MVEVGILFCSHRYMWWKLVLFWCQTYMLWNLALFCCHTYATFAYRHCCATLPPYSATVAQKPLRRQGSSRNEAVSRKPFLIPNYTGNEFIICSRSNFLGLFLKSNYLLKSTFHSYNFF